MPKWKLRPPDCRADKSPAPSKVKQRVGGGGQVGRTAQQPGHVLRDLVEHLARRRRGWPSPWHRPGRASCRRPSRRAARRVPISSQLGASSGYCSAIVGQQLAPILLQLAAAGSRCLRAKWARTSVGHQELRVFAASRRRPWSGGFLLRPAAPRGPRAYRACGGAPGDHAADDDQRGPVGGVLEPCQRLRRARRSLTSATLITFQP